MSKRIVMVTAAGTALEPSPIPKDWILAGTPEARNKEVARSHDRTSYTSVWECSPGRFNWHYTKDEVLVVVSGEALDRQCPARWGSACAHGTRYFKRRASKAPHPLCCFF